MRINSFNDWDPICESRNKREILPSNVIEVDVILCNV